MAKKRTTIEETIPDGTTLENDGAGIINDLQEDEELSKVLSAYGPSPVHCKVYRVGKGKPEFCYASDEAIDEEQIQDMFGAGKYAIRVYVNEDLKRTVYVAVAAKPNADGSNNNGAKSVAEMQISMLQQQLTQTTQLLMAVIGRPTPIQPQTSLMEVATAMQTMSSLRPESDNTSKIILEKCLDALINKESSAGGFDWKTELIKTAREVAGPLAVGLMKNNAPPTVATVNQPSNVIALPESPEIQMDNQIRQALMVLKPKIMSGMPVELAVDWIASNATDEQYQPLVQYCLKASFEDIVKLDPTLANEPFNSWIRKFLEGIKDAWKDEPETPQEQETA